MRAGGGNPKVAELSDGTRLTHGKIGDFREPTKSLRRGTSTGDR